jgi:hypothetical protein
LLADIYTRTRIPNPEIESHEDTKSDETKLILSARVRFVSFVPSWRPCRFPGRIIILDYGDGSALIRMLIAGWSSLEAREAHNLKVAGSNPAPATPQPSPTPCAVPTAVSVRPVIV